MSTEYSGHDHASMAQRQAPQTATRWPLYVFLVILAIYLLTQHREHLLGWLPYLIFLACPLMHFFHRGAHGGHTDTSAVAEARTGSGGLP